MADTDDQAQPPPEDPHQPAQQAPDADPPAQEDSPLAQEAPTYPQPDNTNRPKYIVKMRPVPQGWSAIWDPTSGRHWYWQPDTDVTTWDLPLVRHLPKATLHPLMATATSTVLQDTGHQQPPGSLATALSFSWTVSRLTARTPGQGKAKSKPRAVREEKPKQQLGKKQ